MEQKKKHFKVYYVGRGEGCYAKDYSRELLGETWAISKEKACSNVRYRHRNKQNPNGGYSSNILGDSLDMGFVKFEYEAVEIV